MRARIAVVVAAALLLGGCASGGTPAASPSASVPPAPIGKYLHREYRTMNVYRARLSGQQVPEVIVVSRANAWVKADDPNKYGLQAGLVTADVQVLTWDASAHEWREAYDAQQRNPKPAVIDNNDGPADTSDAQYQATHVVPFDHTAAITNVQVAMAKLLPGPGEQLVLGSDLDWGGSGNSTNIVALSFPAGRPRLDYYWLGGGSARFKVIGDRIHASAWYWAPSDGHCCNTRTYPFTVGAKQTASGVQLRPITDGRPYLGVSESGADVNAAVVPLVIDSVATDGPAHGKLFAGDVIEKVLNPPPGGVADGDGYLLEDLITRFSPGDVAQLLVRRHGVDRVVSVRLGSMVGIAQQSPPPTTSL